MEQTIIVGGDVFFDIIKKMHTEGQITDDQYTDCKIRHAKII